MTDKNTISSMKNNVAAIIRAKAIKDSDNIDTQVFNNMKTHYSALMKVGAKDFGGNTISMSIFSKIDTDGNNELSESEIANANLDVIIKNSVEEHKMKSQLEGFFGERYTEQSKKTDPNSEQSTTEQIINNNIKEATAQILEYAEQYPDDDLLQQYASKLKVMLENDEIIGADIMEKYALGETLSPNRLKPDGVILVDNHDRLDNLDKRTVLKAILHELGHAISGDDLNSFAEEHDVEVIARDLAVEISGQEVYEEPMERFISAYKGLPAASPGTYDIPLNAGVSTKFVPNEIVTEDNVLKIKSEVDGNGNRTEEHITYGEETDSDGNPIPVSAKRVIINQEGEIVFSADYDKYDKTRKCFNGSGKVNLKQMKFESNGKTNSFGLS